MNPAAALLAPLLLLPGAVVLQVPREADQPVIEAVEDRTAGLTTPVAMPNREAAPFENGLWELVTEAFRSANQQQVRIEQRLTIRITPRAPELRPNMLADLPTSGIPSNLTERRMGRCLQVSGIAGVQMGGDSKLILFMRDQRIVSATLEKTCRARDFYSGFYMARSEDGMLCTHRDTLQSRAGANCQLTALKQLVDSDDD
ncbi:MAG TPA: hypothetical protein VHG29_09235 [Novosphingobium sp.]|nr:hypothetical protein [Novosphingobium sp.]